LIKADEQTLLNFVSSKAKVRAGFHELLAYCRQQDFCFVIVSNGLIFYIEAILRQIGIDNIDILAATTDFTDNGVDTKYIGPKGNLLQDGFKETYVKLFLNRGYRLVYIGNGTSDTLPARQAHHIFATGELLTYCQQTNLNCTPFTDLNDVVSGLELLP
jgi:2-hydroxy-3-keto-5-methylthiopentenyl-1-phosphate phosphatase